MFRIVERKKLKKIAKSEIVVCCTENNELKDSAVEVIYAVDDVVKYLFRVHYPTWLDGKSGEKEFLSRTYIEIFEEAVRLGCSSIQIPLISEEIPFFPIDIAYTVAISECSKFLDKYDFDVVLVITNPKSISNNDKIFPEIANYIELLYKKGYKNPVFIEDSSCHGGLFVMEGEESPEACDILPMTNKVREELQKAGKPFSEHLKAIMEKKNMEPGQLCRRANFDRQYFSKLMTNKLKKPSKNRLFMLAIALCLNLEETTDLLNFLGYAFSYNEKIDIIVKHYISNEVYNMTEIDACIYKETNKTLCDYE